LESQSLIDRARLRALEVLSAKRDGFSPSREEMEQAAAEFCQQRGLASTEQLRAALSRQGISAGEFDALMADQACVTRSHLIPAYQIERYITDVLRLEGRSPASEQTSAAAE
jgi:hypothetical protein